MSGPLTGATATDAELSCRTIDSWRTQPLWHGFLGRHGGVSQGDFATLNFSYQTGDDAAAVDCNWRRLRERFGPDTAVAMVRQVHGVEIHQVSRADADRRPDGDGMVSTARNLVLGVLTADCVPILLVDPEAGVIGALHAGWRGVLAGIAPRGVAKMTALAADPSRIQAALGPAIGGCCFEVDAQLAERFTSEDPDAARHIRAGVPGKAYIDLKGLLRDQLVGAGLGSANVFAVPDCTRCASGDYFSRRGAGGKITGLQLSFVGFQP